MSYDVLNAIDLALVCSVVMFVVPLVLGGNGRRPLGAFLLCSALVLVWSAADTFGDNVSLQQHLRQEILAASLLGCTFWAVWRH